MSERTGRETRPVIASPKSCSKSRFQAHDRTKRRDGNTARVTKCRVERAFGGSSFYMPALEKMGARRNITAVAAFFAVSKLIVAATSAFPRI